MRKMHLAGVSRQVMRPRRLHALVLMLVAVSSLNSSRDDTSTASIRVFPLIPTTVKARRKGSASGTPAMQQANMEYPGVPGKPDSHGQTRSH